LGGVGEEGLCNIGGGGAKWALNWRGISALSGVLLAKAGVWEAWQGAGNDGMYVLIEELDEMKLKPAFEQKATPIT
jgi:hypothetical protein